MGKSKRQLADEAWLRLNTPDNTGALPGQLTIEGAIASAEAAAQPPRPAPPSLDPIPERCPACDVILRIDHGWVCSKWGEPTVQCPRCATRYSVTREEHERYREAVMDYYAKLPKPALPKRGGGRTRGAR